MGDDDDVAMGMLGVEPPRHGSYSLCQGVESLIGERKAVRMLQIGLEVTREHRWQVAPRMTLPPPDHAPFGEVGVDLDRDRGTSGDLFGRAQRALERRGPDGYDRSRAQIATNSPRLLHTVWRQPEPGEVGVDQMPRVLDLGVANQMYQCSHEDIVVGRRAQPR